MTLKELMQSETGTSSINVIEGEVLASARPGERVFQAMHWEKTSAISVIPTVFYGFSDEEARAQAVEHDKKRKGQRAIWTKTESLIRPGKSA